jgi:hypothetical protein
MGQEMNRDPSTDIRFTGKNSVPAFPRDRALLTEVLAAARLAFPQVSGLTRVSATRAYFQANGDPTHYSLAVSGTEAVALGYVDTGVAALAKRMGVTEDQIRAQFIRVADKMDSDIAAAEKAGKSKVGKYDLAVYRQHAMEQRAKGAK